MHIVVCIYTQYTLTEGENAVHFAERLQSQLLELLVFLDCMTDAGPFVTPVRAHEMQFSEWSLSKAMYKIQVERKDMFGE